MMRAIKVACGVLIALLIGLFKLIGAIFRFAEYILSSEDKKQAKADIRQARAENRELRGYRIQEARRRAGRPPQ
jgi:hypothetical protein